MSWIRWLESRKLVTAAPDETVAAVVERMVERNVGAVLVVRDGKLSGIFTERDVMARVVLEGRDPRQTRVDGVCTSEPQTVREDADVATCAGLVKRYGFRHVPVVDAEGAPVAVISSRDFLRYVIDGLEQAVVEAYRERRREQLVDPYEMVAWEG